ncbi:phosphoenolpyruvate synthase [Amnibacterium kyonggiense]|uniref:Phosphoenolpyruvate synthase n=1 Tax=Amnibacterium kyonggiense TaxID=595671 RepID=A0A4R7FKG3_9MICO|nr:phosphoenolpyruvate synthase [Amnibacterium kyonggiense]TDS76842.1 phosphoenolpyruvate synthase [Amnibacterium kyonggiense]
MTNRWIRSFDDLGIDDVPLVGGKNASLGELHRALTPEGVRVPDGFAVTADAYRAALDAAGAWAPLHALLDDLDPDDAVALRERAAAARRLVYEAGLPEDVAAGVLEGYRALQREYGDAVRLAVRSSATAEDLPDVSFAGQHESYLDVRGDDALLDAVRRCFASLFTDRAIHYRFDRGFDHFSVALSVGVMRMVRSDLAASGVLFTLDTESGFRDVVLISGAYGLGEDVVQGVVDPDEFTVHKPTFEAGHRVVLRHELGAKAQRMVLTPDGTGTRNEPVPEADRRRYCLTDDEVLELAGQAVAIERHYGRPMDVEWAKDGADGALFVVQARPETVAAARSATVVETFHLDGTGPVIATGRAVGERIATGTARRVRRPDDLAAFRPGDVLVAETTTPDWEPVMRTAAAVVTDQGGRTCHAAILARELGIPAVVGTGDATSAVPDGSAVTVSCAEGEVGSIREGVLPFRVEREDVTDLPRPHTAVMLNIGDPSRAFAASFLPNDGVGLARMEFVIGSWIGAHPLALLHPEEVPDAETRSRLAAIIGPDGHGGDAFVQRLAEGIGTIAAAFWPKPVVARLSDFKSNEYAGLLGGRWFEPVEENPMLGFRGAARYVHKAYEEAFELECRAMRRVRDEMGFTNVVLMVPFVRRVAEADAVLARMAEHGLARGRNGLRIFAMCEIPNNVVQIDAFARRFDGMSIGSNDLTQLTLGVDRDSAIVADDYDERDPGVLELIRQAVEGCRRAGVHSGLCGQAPSDYPDVAAFLTRIGIDSISLNPDSVLRATRSILGAEAAAPAAVR